MLKLWSARVYFRGDGAVAKADCEIELRALNAEDARDAAIQSMAAFQRWIHGRNYRQNIMRILKGDL